MNNSKDNQYLINAVIDAREDALLRLSDAARALRADPNNFDAYYQIQYCLKAYVEAQQILNPVFFS